METVETKPLTGAAKAAADRKAEMDALKAENEELRNQLAVGGSQSSVTESEEDTPKRPAPKQVHSQTQPSNSLALAQLDRVNYFYVKVPHTALADEPLHFDEYLDKPSPSDPSKAMYEVVAMGATPEERRLTGSAKMALLRCSIKDKRLEMAADAEASGHREAAKTAGVGANNIPGQFEEFEDMQGGLMGTPDGLLRI